MRSASPAMVAYLASLSEVPQDVSLFVADLYTITLVNGTIFRWCSGPSSIKLDTHTFISLSPSNTGVPTIERSKISSTIGLSVDDLTITINATPLVMADGTQMLAAMIRGDFDGANVLVQRMIMKAYGDTTLGPITLFAGFVGDINDIGSTTATVTVKALTDLLNIDMPRNLYQPGCRHTLFDAGCTLNKTSFVVSGAVTGSPTVITIPTNLTQAGPVLGPSGVPSLSQTTTAGINLSAQSAYVVYTYVGALGESAVSPQGFISLAINSTLVAASPPSATGITGYNVYVGQVPGNWQLQNQVPIAIGTDYGEGVTGFTQGIPPPLVGSSGYFTQGIINFTSGPNVGLSRYVIDYGSPGAGIVTIVDALPIAPASGDTFTITPGCSKTVATCSLKFNNLINIGSTPFVPIPESAL